MRRNQSGIALVLVLLVIVILYVVTTQVVYTSRLEDMSANNEALLARMDLAMERALEEALTILKDDAMGGDEGGAAAAGGAGAIPGVGGGEGGGGEAPGGMPGGAGGGGEGGEEAPAPCDSKNDGWNHPATYVDEDITIYTWVEDENRKFNVLSILSKDEQFARESEERLVRVIDLFREDTEFDISRSDAEMIARRMKEYMDGTNRPEDLGIPEQVSDVEENEIRLPKALEEFLVLPGITEEVLYDQVRGEMYYPGLSRVLTVHTSHTLPEMEDPEGLTNRRSAPGRSPAAATGGTGGTGTGSGTAGGNTGGATGGNTGGTTGQPAGGTGGEGGGGGAAEPLGVGIRINVNTAPRAVLRSLLSDIVLPAQVVEAILEYRNEEVEEDEEGAAEEEEPSLEEELGLEDQAPKTNEFTSLEDLDQVDEFKNWGVEEDRDKLLTLLTTESDVFTIHLAATYKVNEERHVVFVRRAKATVRRELGAEGEEPRILWITPLIEQGGHLVIDYPDFPELERERQEAMEFTGDFADISAGELYWNPFRFQFYYREEEGLHWRPEER